MRVEETPRERCATVAGKECVLRRFIHYVWRHWEQLRRIPGISWPQIVRCRTMMDMDRELSCKVQLRHMLI